MDEEDKWRLADLVAVFVFGAVVAYAFIAN